MTWTFTEKDLTIVVPTLARPVLESLLALLMQRADVHQVICIIDSGEPLPPYLATTLPKISCIRHDRNRGLAAARNTGMAAARTKLTMFIDDDIVPQSEFVADVINFHNTYPSPKAFGTGKVTWKGTPYENCITNWFEDWGGWSIFKTISAGTHLPRFSGGFTSFQTSIRESLSFSEEFVRYGCEDIEFGIRLKAQGGEMRGNPQLLGLHHSAMNAAVYAKNHRGAGYSQGTMFRYHPDCAFPLQHFERNLRLHSRPGKTDILVQVVDQLVSQACLTGEEIHPYMQLLTEAAIGEGHIEHEMDTYPGFAEGINCFLSVEADRLSRLQRTTAACPSHPLFWMLRAKEEKERGLSEINSLRQAANCIDLYVAPLLALDALGDAEARTRLWEIFRTRQATLDTTTFKKVAERLGEAPQNNDADSVSLAAMYSAMQHSDTGRASAIGLGLAILEKEIGHVGAALGLAELLEDEAPAQSRFFANLAQYFVKFRPAHEQIAAHQRLHRLYQQRKIEQ